MTLRRLSFVSEPQPRAQHRSIALWLVAACAALPAVTTAQTSADIISAVEASRANIARLEVAPPPPFVCAPPAAVQCATPAPKGEFETTAAFEARLTAAEQTCNAGRRQADDDARNTCRSLTVARELEIKKDQQFRADMREQQMILPIWNATALYDADRGAFLLNLGDIRGDVTLGKSLDDSMQARLAEFPKDVERVCAVSVQLSSAANWRDVVSLFLEFRLDSLNPTRIRDAVLVSSESATNTMTRTRLTDCLVTVPPRFSASAKKLKNPLDREAQSMVSAAERAAAEAAQVASAAAERASDAATEDVLLEVLTSGPVSGEIRLAKGGVARVILSSLVADRANYVVPPLTSGLLEATGGSLVGRQRFQCGSSVIEGKEFPSNVNARARTLQLSCLDSSGIRSQVTRTYPGVRISTTLELHDARLVMSGDIGVFICREGSCSVTDSGTVVLQVPVSKELSQKISAAAAQARSAAEASSAGIPLSSCGDAPLNRDTPIKVGGNIKPPQKIRDVRPIYSALAQSARVQGVVIIEATIGPDGSVTKAKVLRSIPLLDQAALDAVRQWQFTPTLRCGIPVPVYMTTSVSFTLQ